MNTEQFRQNMENAKVAREVIELAGLDIQSALVPLQAVSEKQRNFAGDIRHAVLADVWQNLKADFRTKEMAATVIRAVNHHKDAKWWCNHERKMNMPKAFVFELREDIKQERGK